MLQPAAKRRLNSILFAIFLCFGLFVVAELTAMGALQILKKWKGIEYTPLPEVRLSDEQNSIVQRLLAGEEGYIRYHPQLGWQPNPATKKEGHASNAQALRAASDVREQPDAGVMRIATYGDSFTFGHGVVYEETWQAYLASRRPDWEVINFGVSGYAQDQAYLRYKGEGRRYRSRVEIFGFNSENIFRNLNVFRPFYSPKTEFPLTKPRFVMEDSELRLLPNPFQRLGDYQQLLDKSEATIRGLGTHDYYYHQLYRTGKYDGLAIVRYIKLIGYQLSEQYHPDMLFLKDNLFNVDSEGYQVAVRIIDQFVAQVKQDGAIPVILILPTRKDLSQRANGRQKQYIRFLEYWEKQKYHVLDLNELIYNDKIDVRDPKYYTEDGHNAGPMHERIAEHLARFLTDDVLPKHEQ